MEELVDEDWETSYDVSVAFMSGNLVDEKCGKHRMSV